MMNLKVGDLVHIPAGSYRIKYRTQEEDGQMSIPWDCNLCMRPLVGVFKETVNERECVIVFHVGEWVIDSSCVYLKNKGDEYDRISEYSKEWKQLVS
jgi:hypothetical protein